MKTVFVDGTGPLVTGLNLKWLRSRKHGSRQTCVHGLSSEKYYSCNAQVLCHKDRWGLGARNFTKTEEMCEIKKSEGPSSSTSDVCRVKVFIQGDSQITPRKSIEVKVGITFQDDDRFNSCQVIYSQFGLEIHQNDHQAKRRFVEWAQNEIAVVPDFHKRILFSDEAHFWLNGYVNKQNYRIWSEANPQVYVETPLHPEKLTVWCALWAGGILRKR
ncbi:uncharacterized protein TNCV_3022511 [Trichonephila clavipes]|nr:uncharacterized protein TNCV_3022511 [Trichonephila clavipes]